VLARPMSLAWTIEETASTRTALLLFGRSVAKSCVVGLSNAAVSGPRTDFERSRSSPKRRKYHLDNYAAPRLSRRLKARRIDRSEGLSNDESEE